MIVRALFVSLVLHLAILVSGAPELPGSKESDQGGRRGIVAVLPGAGAVRDAGSVANAIEKQSQKSLAGSGKTKSIAPAKAADYSKIASFSGPTVAFANHGQNAGRQAGGEDAPDVFLPAGDGEREYRLNLAREARRYKRYPAGVGGRSAEGVVVVSVSVQLVAHRPAIRLQQSSGDEALDLAALEMMERAANVASIPQELQGRRFRIAVPVEYRLAGD